MNDIYVKYIKAISQKLEHHFWLELAQNIAKTGQKGLLFAMDFIARYESRTILTFEIKAT